MKEAMFWSREDRKVRCGLCGWRCLVAEGGRGACGVRENRAGKLYSLVYGRACSLAVDPVEKKPFFHFEPGTATLSVATVGCNFRCAFCQNWEMAHPKANAIFGERMAPERLVETALEQRCDGMSYTYTEPTVFYEYAYDTAKFAHENGLYNTFVSNGYTAPEAIRKIAPYLDADNVDFKGSDRFYRDVCGVPSIEPVYACLKALKKHGVWTEITNLLIPGKNDSNEDIAAMCNWIVENLGSDVPLHFSRFYPSYKMLDVPATPVETLERALGIARDAGLRWLYIGNVPGHRNESTWCWNCDELLVRRHGFSVIENRVQNRKCPACGKGVPVKTRKDKKKQRQRS